MGLLARVRGWSRSAKVVALAVALFIGWFGVSVWFRHLNLWSAQFDLGNMDQVLWHALHGEWFQLNNPGAFGTMLRSAFHADFLLLAYLPFYAVWADPRTLLVLQVIAVASGAIPLYLIARRRLSGGISAAAAIGYLLYPPLGWAVTFDVHAVVLATPLLLWAWWAAERHRMLAFVFIVLACLGKEQVGLTAAAVGIYWLVHRRTRRLGLATFLFGLAWSIIMVSLVIPDAREVPGHFALGFYSEYGDSTQEILGTLAAEPWKIFSGLFTYNNLVYVGLLLLPVAGLAVFGLPILLLALPELGINLLSSNPAQHSIFFQYTSVITPFVFLAAIAGWSRLQKIAARRLPNRPRLMTRWIPVGAAVIMAFFIWKHAPLPGTRYHQAATQYFTPSPYRDDVRQVKQLLRSGDRVAATNNLVPQFSRRDHIWAFPNDLDHADAIVVLLGKDYEVVSKEQVNAVTTELSENSAFELVLRHDDFYYFRRR